MNITKKQTQTTIKGSDLESTKEISKLLKHKNISGQL